MNVTKETTEKVLGEFANYGFSLKQAADNKMELYHKDKRIAVFNQLVMPTVIQEGCRNYLASITRQE